MTAKYLKATALVLVGSLASVAALAQDEAAPVVPAGPTPQEIAAENLDQLLQLVEQGRVSANRDNAAREARFSQDSQSGGRTSPR